MGFISRTYSSKSSSDIAGIHARERLDRNF
jgi:hypothetical protein